MMIKTKHLLSVLAILYMPYLAFSQDSIAFDSTEMSAYIAQLQRANELQYQTGEIDIDGIATLNLPQGFKYLNADDANFVMTDLWGNPPEASVTMGLIFPDTATPFSEKGYAVNIEFEDEGYVDDEDAADIDYDDLLEEMQEGTLESNKIRTANGYPAIELVGWASAPYYDAVAKKLHWAKEIRFEGSETNTLNYNIRILGRKGYLVLNAIAQMEDLPLFQKDVDVILGSVEFNEGHRYADFDPDIDKIAAYGIGGLIAGKVLAKAGIFALLLKNIKFVIIAVVAGFAAFRKKIFGKKSDEGE